MSLTDYIKKSNIGNPIGSQNSSEQIDKRIRIRCRPGQESIIYGNPTVSTNPMSILHQTNGIIFPFTPSINVKQNASWANQGLTHSLQDYYYFKTVQSTEISITGKFTAQNHYEGRYLLAVLHFLRSYAKMYFGTSETEEKRGLPPPVLLLDGYGSYVFNSLPVIILDWSFEFPSDIDYVKIMLDSATTLNNQNLNNPNISNTITSPIQSQARSLTGDLVSKTGNSRFSATNTEDLNRKINSESNDLNNLKKLINQRVSETSPEELQRRIANFDPNQLERGRIKNLDLNLPTPNLLNVNQNNNLTRLQSSSITSNYNYAYLPTITNISINLVVQRPPTTLKREFNLQDFREGRLITKKGFI